MGIYVLVKKTVIPEGFTARTVILDIEDSYGGSGIGLRSVDFYSNDSLIDIEEDDLESYYPDDEGRNGMRPFITAYSKTGSYTGTSYYINGSFQRIICEFKSPITFDKIIINNFHDYGEITNNGAKTVRMFISTSGMGEDISDDWSGEIANCTTIFEGDFDRHIDSDVIDNQQLSISDLGECVFEGP